MNARTQQPIPSAIKGLLAATAAAALLAGCGLADTTTTAAAVGASEVQQAQQAKTILGRVKQQLDADQKIDAQQRQAAESDAQ